MTETSRPPELRNDRPLIFILALGLVVAFGIATQYVAWRLAFAPGLGPTIVVFDALTRRLLRAIGILLIGAGVSVVFVRGRRAHGCPVTSGAPADSAHAIAATPNVATMASVPATKST